MKFSLTLSSALLFGLLLAACDETAETDSCEASLTQMEVAVRNVLASGSGCVNDAECVLYDTSNACYGACPVSINMRDLTTVDAAITNAEDLYCQDYEANCGLEAPSTCTPVRPVCTAGMCTVMSF